MLPETVLEKNEFTFLASETQIERTRVALEANQIHTLLAQTGAEASQLLFDLLPEQAEIFVASSTTLNTLGITQEIDTSGRYNSVRAKLALMDPQTQEREMQKMGATPEYILGSVHAITEKGQVIIASLTGSQLAGYVSAAEHVIWVAGTQKIVPNLEVGLKRLETYTLPLESARALKAYGVTSAIHKLLIINKEFNPGRVTLILVKENLGF